MVPPPGPGSRPGRTVLSYTRPMDEPVTDLAALRERLDALDADLVDLIAERFAVIATVGAQKEGTAAAIRDPKREREILESVETMARSKGISVPLVRRIFEELLSQSVIQQSSRLRGGARRVRVGYQGVEFAYSHLAAQKYVAGRQLEGTLIGFRSFAQAADALLAGDIDLVVAPIENTTAGSITEVYNLLRERELSIVGEETWHADHCLAAVAEVPPSALERILSHPLALDQCSQFLDSLPGVIAVPHFDTSGAMRFVAEQGDPAQAAIGSRQAAEAAGLVVIRDRVANSEENYTRFVVLARHSETVDSRVSAKTSLILVTRHEQGALVRCLEILSAHNLSMTKLESRPRPGQPWEYMFFIDILGNIAEQETLDAVDELRSAALHLKLLGSYPATATTAEPQKGRVRPKGAAAAAPATNGAPPATTPARVVQPSKNYKLASRAARAQDTVIRVGNTLVGGDGFVVMAGPCAVESAEQVEATARAVRDLGAHILRGGVFKPRTSPYAFQGHAWEGLEMLHAAGRKNGMPIISEVMAVEQVQRMAQKVDILQVGARNMQNFDLLRELGKVDRPVLLKRGLSSTIEEWLGAAEYILAHGNQQVMLCERGIRTFESATRNTLDLSAVCVLKERTHLPVIVDPSHGTGYRPYVAPMARAARAVGAHGLLIEVHPDPDHALSDSDQSLNFDQFAELMRGLEAIG
jgi:chorismate mutase/prephenate dehydratase